MLFQCIADTHGQSVLLNDSADAVIILGDTGGRLYWDIKDLIMSNPRFSDKVFAILGNHDDESFIENYPWIRWMLYGEETEICGYQVLFLPYKDSPGELKNMPQVDIVFSHTPVMGLLDDSADPFHQGSREYLKYLCGKHPRMWVHGHMHISDSLRFESTLVKCVYQSETLEFY